MSKGGDKASAQANATAANNQYQQYQSNYQTSPYILQQQQEAADWLNQANSGQDISTLPGIAGNLARLSPSDFQNQRVPYLGGAAMAENSFLQPVAQKQAQAQEDQERGAEISDIATQEYNNKLAQLYTTSGIQNQVEYGKLQGSLGYDTTQNSLYSSLLNKTPWWQQALTAGIGAAGTIGGAAIGACFVAAELYGGWNVAPTRAARKYFRFKAPKWLSNFYGKYSLDIAFFLFRHPEYKKFIKPLFDYWFVRKGKKIY